jgi:hypothetical protein
MSVDATGSLDRRNSARLGPIVPEYGVAWVMGRGCDSKEDGEIYDLKHLALSRAIKYDLLF